MTMRSISGKDAASLKNLRIIVPKRVRLADSALLTCSYDLENAQLYAIKWYFEDQEFYRFVPRKEPPHDTFPVSGIQVNVLGSNMQDVTLVNLQRNHSGRYKCEVSEDQPRYDTKLREADIFVVDVPEHEPRIAVDRQRLGLGDQLRANCTSGASRPAPNITWTLNGKSLDSHGGSVKFSLHTHALAATKSGGRGGGVGGNFEPETTKQRSRSKLRLSVVNGNTFHGGRLRLRCFAEITPVYKAGSATIDIWRAGIAHLNNNDNNSNNDQQHSHRPHYQHGTRQSDLDASMKMSR
ncbi:hypothetical protein TKK_0004676 [Trichogramma kaykai]